jgi:glutathione S-transferase
LKCKTATPFGHVPILEVDGRVLAQSNTIARYLAKKHGLAGQDEWEEALADMYADNIHDLLNGNLQLRNQIILKMLNPYFSLRDRPGLLCNKTAVAVPFVEKDPVKKKELYQNFMRIIIAPHVAAVEKQLKKNNTGYLVGNQVETFFRF